MIYLYENIFTFLPNEKNTREILGGNFFAIDLFWDWFFRFEITHKYKHLQSHKWTYRYRESTTVIELLQKKTQTETVVAFLTIVNNIGLVFS